MRSFYPDDIYDFPEHWHDPWADPCERSAPTFRFLWGVAHAGNGDHGGPCAERAYEALGIGGQQSPKCAVFGKGSGSSLER